MTEARKMDAERMDMSDVPESERTDDMHDDSRVGIRRDDTRADDLAVDEPDETRADRSTMDLGPDTMPAGTADDRLDDDVDPSMDGRHATSTPTPTSQPAATTGTGTLMPAGAQHTATTTPVAATQGDTHRLDDDWRSVQASFVDDPADAVHEADALVGRLIDEIIRERETLSGRNTASGETEELRQALREYRKLYQRLVPADRS